jgi:hypothetical protein
MYVRFTAALSKNTLYNIVTVQKKISHFIYILFNDATSNSDHTVSMTG